MLEILIILDVSPGLARAPALSNSRKAALTKNGAAVLVAKVRSHPSNVSASNSDLPRVLFSGRERSLTNEE